MSRKIEPAHISQKVVVYRAPGMDDVKVRRDVAYSGSVADALSMDIYYPPDWQEGARIPAVIIVAGFPDAGFEAHVGCKFKEMKSSVSWGRLMAASGVAAITYTNREPAADLQALIQHVRRNAAQLGIDADRLGVWASSGNVPLALSTLMREGNLLRCAVLFYGYTLDLDGSTHVAEAARKWGFANSCAGKSIADLPPDTPLFVARAGQDQMPHLNETLDRFLSAALTRNLPVTFTNHRAAPHAFDLLDDGETSREVVRQALEFMRFHLLTDPPAGKNYH